MKFITWPCKQKAVYWAPGSEESGGSDYDEYANPLYASPIELNCRWDNTIQNTVAFDGTQITSIAQVIVDTEVKVKGVLWLGKLEDVVDIENPKSNSGAGEIQRVSCNPSITAIEYIMIAYL